MVPIFERFEAEKLAALIANFPPLCLKMDRLSAYEQFDLPYIKAMENEFNRGIQALAKEGVGGAKKSLNTRCG